MTSEVIDPLTSQPGPFPRGDQQLAVPCGGDALAVEVLPGERQARPVPQQADIPDARSAEIAPLRPDRVEPRRRRGLVVDEREVLVAPQGGQQRGEPADVGACEAPLVQRVGEAEQIHVRGAGRAASALRHARTALSHGPSPSFQ